MIQSFKVQGIQAKEFVEKVTLSLKDRELGKIASLSLTDGEIIVLFSKLGKSEVHFSLKPLSSGGFECIHASEKIALTHKALRGDIEQKLAKILIQNGAEVLGK